MWRHVGKYKLGFYPLGKTKWWSTTEPSPLMTYNYPLKYDDQPETYINTIPYRVVNTHRLLVQRDNHTFVPRTMKMLTNFVGRRQNFWMSILVVRIATSRPCKVNVAKSGPLVNDPARNVPPWRSRDFPWCNITQHRLNTRSCGIFQITTLRIHLQKRARLD